MDLVRFYTDAIKLYFQRDEGYKSLEKKTDWKEAFLGAYIVTVFLYMVSSVLITAELGVSWIWGIVGSLVVAFIGLVISSTIGVGIIFLLLKVFGGKAEFTDTLKFALSLSILPSIASILLSVIDPAFYGGAEAYTGLSIIFSLLSFAVAIWAFVVAVLVYSRLHTLSVGRTVLALLIPVIIVLVIIFIIALIVGFFWVSSGVVTGV